MQLMVITLIAMTLFFRTHMHHNTTNDGTVYLGALFFAMVTHMFNGFSELALTCIKLPVFFKQRDYLFFPSWAYTIPSWILKIPVSLLEVSVTIFLNYYVIGFDPNVGRLVNACFLILLLN
jgi:ABC-2 type transporter